MPLIELTAPAGALTETGRATIQAELAATLLRWEGAPDNELFRSLAWSHLHELPQGAQATLADDAPRFLVRVTVPEGALSPRRKAGLVSELTAVVVAAAGLPSDAADRVWVLISEQPDGTWGAGGAIVRYEDIVAAAERSRASAPA
jgi:phenylpyruvate tautomerase PptA (4-oxalocrotonate tautomerase family)